MGSVCVKIKRLLRPSRGVTCSDGNLEILGGSHHAILADIGRPVILCVGRIHIVVYGKLHPGFDPLKYTHIGLEPRKTHAIVVHRI